MEKYIKVGFAGLLVSFLGALPLGTLNLTAFDIAASQSIISAFWFAIAVVLVELIVVRLTLYGNERLHLGEKVTFYLIPFGIVLLLYLAFSSFSASASFTEMGSKVAMLPELNSAFLLGLLLSALNPLHIPFWMTWNKVLSTKKVLEPSKRSYAFYLFGIGTGTMTALGIFIFLGQKLFTNYESYSMLTNLFMGLLYLGFSFYLMFLMIKKRPNLKIP